MLLPWALRTLGVSHLNLYIKKDVAPALKALWARLKNIFPLVSRESSPTSHFDENPGIDPPSVELDEEQREFLQTCENRVEKAYGTRLWALAEHGLHITKHSLDTAVRELRGWAKARLCDIWLRIYEAVCTHTPLEDDIEDITYLPTIEKRLKDETEDYLQRRTSSGHRSNSSNGRSLTSTGRNSEVSNMEPDMQKPTVFSGKIETLEVFLSQIMNIFRITPSRILSNPTYTWIEFAKELTAIYGHHYRREDAVHRIEIFQQRGKFLQIHNYLQEMIRLNSIAKFSPEAWGRCVEKGLREEVLDLLLNLERVNASTDLNACIMQVRRVGQRVENKDRRKNAYQGTHQGTQENPPLKYSNASSSLQATTESYKDKTRKYGDSGSNMRTTNSFFKPSMEGLGATPGEVKT
ncbi:hypothetical protein RUND412_006294 [Rhizina undulata]